MAGAKEDRDIEGSGKSGWMGDGDHQGEHIEGEGAARTAGEDYVEGGRTEETDHKKRHERTKRMERTTTRIARTRRRRRQDWLDGGTRDEIGSAK